jgi:hypothetical protein
LLGKTPDREREARRTAMSRVLGFVQFPPIQGVFDAGHGVVYIFGELHESEIEGIIEHETLHFVLLKVAGKKACLRLDRIYSQLENNTEKLTA